MNDIRRTTPIEPAATGATRSRFNALRHGILSTHTLLPWEDTGDYLGLVTALVSEHMPQGPTEEHLVEELAGVIWRKRRLRLAEAAAYRHGLDDALGSRRETAKVALVYLDGSDPAENAAVAVRATTDETEAASRELRKGHHDAACTRPAQLVRRRRLPGRLGSAARGDTAVVGERACRRPWQAG